MESPHFLISDYIKKLDDTDNFRKLLYKKGIMSKIFPEDNLLLIYTKFENSNSIQTDLKNECRSLIIDTEEKKIKSLEKGAILTSIKNLTTFPFVKEALDNGSLSIHGLWHNIGTGELMSYDSKSKKFIFV